jgi:hypothetical protein
MKYTDIDGHEAACRVLEKDPKESPSVHDQLDDIAKAINKLDDNFEADYDNPDQEKHYPIFDASRGFAFGASFYDGWIANTDCGSRLCQRFRNSKIATYYGKKFNDLHKKAFYGK